MSGDGGCCSGGCVCGLTCIECTNNCALPNELTGSASRAIERGDQLPCARDGFEPFQRVGPFVCAQEIAISRCDCPLGPSRSCSRPVAGGGGASPTGDYATCDAPRPVTLPASRLERVIEFDAVLHVLSCCGDP